MSTRCANVDCDVCDYLEDTGEGMEYGDFTLVGKGVEDEQRSGTRRSCARELCTQPSTCGFRQKKGVKDTIKISPGELINAYIGDR